MQKSSVAVLIIAILLAVVASSSAGYLVGSSQSKSVQSAIERLNPTQILTTTIFENSQGSAGSIPISPNPFQYSESISRSGVIWYVPIEFFGRGESLQMYVNYQCEQNYCPGGNTIGSLAILADGAQSFSINQNGVIREDSNLNFTNETMLYQQNDSETILYDITVSPNALGLYTFSVPFGCTLEPVVYVKTAGTSFDYSPVATWLQGVKPSQVECSDQIQVTILGFTNAFYTVIPVEINSTS